MLRGGEATLKAALASSDPGGVNPALASGDGSWVRGSCHEGDAGDRVAPTATIRGDDTIATTGIAGWGQGSVSGAPPMGCSGGEVLGLGKV